MNTTVIRSVERRKETPGPLQVVFARIGRFVTHRPKRILAAAGLAAVLAGALGIHAFGVLKSGGFTSPSSPSQISQDRLNSYFGGEPNLVLLVTARHGNVNDPSVIAAGEALTARLADSRGVDRVASFWSTHSPALRSTDMTEGLVVATVAGGDDAALNRTKALVKEFSVGTDAGGPVTVRAGGAEGANNAITNQIAKDLQLAEGIAIPITFLLLVVAFGTVVAAALPVALGLLAILATLAVLFLLGSLTDVSIYALNVTTAMGLGLAVDYALLMVNRYREELARGLPVNSAVQRAVATAGRTIVFSAGTVAAALAALLVFPVYFLRSFAYAGISVVAISTVSALVVLPALLAVLGTRVNALAVRNRDRLGRAESPFWRRTTTAVMRRPAAAGLAVVVLLIVLGIPFLHVHFGTPDDRVLPTSSPARQVGDALRSGFGADVTDSLEIVTASALSPRDAAEYSHELTSLPGVVSVTTFQQARATWLHATITPQPDTKAGGRLVAEVRALPSPAGVTAYVGGPAAELVDQKHDLDSRLPIAIALIVLTTFIVLFLFTGSVVLPLKALVLNFLSLTAVLGAMVWIFQDGHLKGFLGFTPSPVSTTMPLLLFCIAFGLSMDYEVFVLSRIKELHDAGASNTEAVTGGLARTGRIVTTAAALLAVNFLAIGLSRVSFIQMFGIGTAIAIVIDATLIRGVLVPAFMRMAGDANWWAPPRLRRLYRRIGATDAPAPIPA
jgi:putative drug exporter of the RND superfamily